MFIVMYPCISHQIKRFIDFSHPSNPTFIIPIVLSAKMTYLCTIKHISYILFWWFYVHCLENGWISLFGRETIGTVAIPRCSKISAPHLGSKSSSSISVADTFQGPAPFWGATSGLDWTNGHIGDIMGMGMYGDGLEYNKTKENQ